MNRLEHRVLFNEILHEDGEPIPVARPTASREVIRASARGFSRGSGVTGSSGKITFEIPGRTVFAAPAAGCTGEMEFRFEIGEVTKRNGNNSKELWCEDKVTGEVATAFLPLPTLLP